MNSGIFTQRLSASLSAGLPGALAQYRMAPVHRTPLNSASERQGLRPSAVMLLLCRRQDDGFFIPLIERPEYQGAHSAQISLPGGKSDPSDPDLKTTALRECFEETGIKDVNVLGALSELHIPVSRFLVSPYVGYCPIRDPEFFPDRREVRSLIRLDLEQLMQEDIIERGKIELPGNLKIEAPWFNVQGHKVWGATAMILSEFREVCRQVIS